MLFRSLGVRASREGGAITLDASKLSSCQAPYDLVRRMRASIYVLGPLLARLGKARVSLPGGCAWGPRPIDLHLMAMEKLGAKIELEHGYIHAKCDRLKGTEIVFPISSVGATAQTIMAAALADGETVIENAAREPEITDLAAMLTRMGADILGAGTTTIRIQGVRELAPVDTQIMGDRIEAGQVTATLDPAVLARQIGRAHV